MLGQVNSAIFKNSQSCYKNLISSYLNYCYLIKFDTPPLTMQLGPQTFPDYAEKDSTARVGFPVAHLPRKPDPDPDGSCPDEPFESLWAGLYAA